MTGLAARLLLCIAACAAVARSGGLPPATEAVRVWLDHSIAVTTIDRLIVIDARREAAEMLAAVGVALKWRDGVPRGAPAGPEDVIMHLDSAAPGALSGRALGYTTLGGPECPVIRLLFYRIIDGRGPRLQVALLAHVMAHEITHVLEGTARHSPEGLMKAVWDKADFQAMLFQPLPFAAEDVALLHARLRPVNGSRTLVAE